MKRRNIIIFSFLVSCLIHGLVFSFISVRIERRQAPLIYGWQDILSKKDLLLAKSGPISLPKGVSFSFHDLRKKYFSQKLFRPDFSKFLTGEPIYPFSAPDSKLKEQTSHFYLWKRSQAIPPSKQEQVSYRVFVSDHGKVVFSFPQKLSSDSRENILMQEHLREAANYLGDRFFWTKLEGVIE